MPKTALDRVVELTGVSDIVVVLSKKLSWSELQTLMMYVYEKKVCETSTVADVFKNYRRNRFSAIAAVDPRDLLAVDHFIYSLLPEVFSPVELSPVIPAGANALLTGLDPKVVLSTIRNVEVTGDPSLALSLECAKRRKNNCSSKIGGADINLATSHRPIRLQMFDEDSELTSHFRSFALASAGRDTEGFNRFEIRAMFEQISTWIKLLSYANSIGYEVKEISVEVSDIRIMEKLIATGQIEKEEIQRRSKELSLSPFKQYGINLPGTTETVERISTTTHPDLETNINEMRFTEEKLMKPLKIKYPSVRFYFNLERYTGIGYYSGICYKISAVTFDGDRHSLAGGGACDWTRKLLQSKREHLVTSGFGTELFVRKFSVR